MSSEGGRRPFEVLIVDDDPVDRRLVARAFKDVGSHVRLKFSENGAAALKLMAERDENGAPYRPDACLCDINMPGMSGIDLLEKVKSEDTLLHTPFIMLSSSDDERDIRQCYQNGAASYMCKPNNFQDLCAFVKSFSEYWIESISLPKRLNVGGATDVG